MAPFVTRTIGDVVAEILMTRTAFRGSLLVLEGDDDARIFQRRVNPSICQLIIAGGKPTVSGAVKQAYDLRQTGILGIVDDDYDALCGRTEVNANVLHTDARDMEVLMLRGRAFESVVLEASDLSKVAEFERRTGVTVRRAAIDRATIFGKIRLISRQESWNLDFGQFSPWRFANLAEWAFDEESIVSLVARETGRTSQDIQSLLDATSVADIYFLIHGRDTLEILTIGLRKCLGRYQYPVDRLCGMLRLAFDDREALSTGLFRAITEWERTNPPYRILA